MTRKVVGRFTGLNPQRRPKKNEATAEEDAVEVPVKDQERQVKDSNIIKLVNAEIISIKMFRMQIYIYYGHLVFVSGLTHYNSDQDHPHPRL